jgi:hypothetical protein
VKVLDRKLIAAESIVSAELDNEVVLLNVQTGIYFGLDEVGGRIWALLETGASEDEIFHKLVDEYEVEPNELRADLMEFLDVLTSRGLVRTVNQ